MTQETIFQNEVKIITTAGGAIVIDIMGFEGQAFVAFTPTEAAEFAAAIINHAVAIAAAE